MDDWSAQSVGVGTADGGWDGGSSGGGWGGPVTAGRGTKKFHSRMLVFALAGGLIGAGAGWVIYSKLYDASGSNVLMVGLVLGAIAACILLACCACELAKPCITMHREMSVAQLGLALIGAALVLAMGCLFEFLYELYSAYTPVIFNDFVFAIDDSGSMSGTDPQDLRYSALGELLESMDDDNRVGLVRFVDGVYTTPIDMAPLSEDHRERLYADIERHRSDGGTDIYAALLSALEICERNEDKSRYPVVVLLSDGGSRVPVNTVAKQFLDAGVAINTVSLGHGADETLLQNLAQATGGQYFRVEEAGDLIEAFQHVSTAITYRCLFSPRPGRQRSSILYAVLRVVFLLLPGAAIGLIFVLLLQNRTVTRQVIVSAVTGLLAGLVMEIGHLLFLPAMAVQLVSWVLYSIVLVDYIDDANGGGQSGVREIDVGDRKGAFEDFMGGLGEDGKSIGSGTNANGAGAINRNDDWGGF